MPLSVFLSQGADHSGCRHELKVGGVTTRVRRIQRFAGASSRTSAPLGGVNVNASAATEAFAFYTFQGLTGDGKYYLAAVLPVSHPELPSTSFLTAEETEKLGDFQVYLIEASAWLEGQPVESFSPTLSTLDALVQSIAVR